MNVLVLAGLFMGVWGLFVVSWRYLNCLLLLEGLNILLLSSVLLGDISGFHVVFVPLLVMFTMEAVLGLLALVRVCGSGSLFCFFVW